MGWQLKFELLYFCLQGSSTIPENLNGRFSFIYLFGNLYWNLFHCISIMKYLITAVLVHKFSLLHLVSSLQTQVTGLPTGCWGLSLSLCISHTRNTHKLPEHFNLWSDNTRVLHNRSPELWTIHRKPGQEDQFKI